jgi:Cytochrome c554 and c-prime
MKISAASGYPPLVVLLVTLLITMTVFADTGKRYVGSHVCEECHTDQSDAFLKHASKADSYESVTVMRKGLTDSEYRECLKCHSTGYGQPGGFVSETETPHLKNAGCEVCHGPGSVHAETGDPEDIIADITIDICATCHIPERVNEFRYKPLLHGGAH